MALHVFERIALWFCAHGFHWYIIKDGAAGPCKWCGKQPRDYDDFGGSGGYYNGG